MAHRLNQDVIATARQPRRWVTVARGGLAGFIAVVVLMTAVLMAREPALLHPGTLAFVVAVSGILITGVIWLSMHVDVEVRLAVDDIRGVRVSGRQVRLDLSEIRQIRRFCMAGRHDPVEVLRLLGPRIGQHVVASSTMDGYEHLRQRLLEHRRLAGLITGPTRWDAAVFKLRPCSEDPLNRAGPPGRRPVSGDPGAVQGVCCLGRRTRRCDPSGGAHGHAYTALHRQGVR